MPLSTATTQPGPPGTATTQPGPPGTATTQPGAPGIVPDDACSIVMPVGRQGLQAVAVMAPLQALTGRRLAVIDISKVRSDVFADELAQALQGGGAAVVDRYLAPPSQRMDAEELQRLGTTCDGAVLALADCGTCTSWTLVDAIELHRHGCRAVVVTTHDLRPMVAALAPRLGMAQLPVVSVALANREHQADGIRATARAAAGEVIRALTDDWSPVATASPTASAAEGSQPAAAVLGSVDPLAGVHDR